MTSAAVELLVLGTPAPTSTLQCMGLRSGNTQVRVNELIMCTITIKDVFGAATTGVPQDFVTPVIVNGVLALSGLVSPVSNYATVTFNITASNTPYVNISVSLALTGSSAALSQGPITISIVGSPSNSSTLMCFGTYSNAGILVRTNENVSCTIYSIDHTSMPAIAGPSDFASVLSVGGQNQSEFVQGSATTVTFYITAPMTVGATFNVLGRLISGENFSVVPFELSVGKI